ncbi:MAG TPA: hypothetical protein VIB48_14335 [Acidimicrobiia bacterium]|jgi:hypothetical protein
MNSRLVVGAVALVSMVTFGIGCSKSTTDAAKKTVKNATNDIKRDTAIGIADALREAIKHQASDKHQSPRSIAVIQAAINDIPGTPDVSGVVDANHDGLDDDGRVEVKVGDQYACLTIPQQGDTYDTKGGRC